MRISLGLDEHGGDVIWDTDASPLLNILGRTGSGKSTLLDRIIRQADARMAVTRFEREDRQLPSPTVMNATYPADGNDAALLDILHRVQAEQNRREKHPGLDMLDTKPLMLVFDDFTAWTTETGPETLRALTEIMQHARATRVSVVTAGESYQQTRDALRRTIGQTSLCDAGTHILLGTTLMDEPIRPSNRDYASSLMLRTVDGRDTSAGCGIQQTNSGGIHALTVPYPQAESRQQ